VLHLTRAALERWRLTLSLVVLVIVAGGYTYLRQPSQEDPEILIRTAVVMVSFPGMSAIRVEQLLVKPVEESLRQVPEIERIRASAQTGLATVKVDLLPTVHDVAPVWANLRNKMADLAPSLPAGTIGPLVNDDYGRVAVTTLALTGADYSMAELRSQARWLRDRLSSLPLVSRVDLYGVQDERIWLNFDRTRLSQLGLSVSSVLSAVAEQNRILPAGSLITEDGMRYALEPSGNFRDTADIGNVPVRTPSGTVVYLRDIVSIERAYVDPPRRPVLFNAQPTVIVALSMVPNVAIRDFAAQVNGTLDGLRHQLPLGMALSVVTDQPPIVEAAIGEATRNLLETLVTVLAVVMVFLGLRAGAIVGAIVPLTIFMSLVGMLLWQIPLHRISIAAIIISLGLLVDNGVVMAEDIKRRLDGGAERRDAALAASRTLAVPLLTSSLTTILAFLPLMLAPDATGEFLRALAQVIILTLLASWFLSCTVTPLLCLWLLPPAGERAAAGRTEWLADRYSRVLRRILARPILLVALTALLFVAGVLGLARVPTGLLPPSDRAQFVVKIELPAGSSDRETLKVVERAARFLADTRENAEVTSSVFYVADGGPRFFLALSPLDPAPHVAFGVVNLANAGDVAAVRERLERFMAAQLPEARGWTERLFLGKEPPGTLEIRLSGPALETLYQSGRRVEALMAAVPGTRDIRTDWANPVLQIDAHIDQERARHAGVAPTQVAQTLEATFEGADITGLREGDRTIPVTLRARLADRDAIDKLWEVTVLSGSGAPVPLVQVSTLAGELQPSVIRRHDQERAITISGINPGMSAQALFDRLRGKLDALDLPPGYAWAPDGEVRASADANGALFQFMPQCLAGIVLILIWQFNSLRRTAIILLTIPLIMIGTSLGLNLLRGTLDFNAMLGLFSLAGIIINNGIVLIDKIDEERRARGDIVEAIVAAATTRLRPIVMTTLTTILGLVPLHLFGGELWYAMTIVMMFGLGVGTVLTLGVVPAFYAVLFRDGTGRAAAPARATG